MVLVERQGIPLGITIAAASPAEVTLVDATLKTRVTPHRRHPKHLVADRAYDSDPLRERLAARGIVLTSPYRDNNLHRRYEDDRRLRTYRHRWIIERTIAWCGAFRRLLIRHERSTRMFSRSFSSPRRSSRCGGYETASRTPTTIVPSPMAPARGDPASPRRL